MHVQDVLPRDAIPSIDDPSFGPAFFGEDSDEVIVVDGDPPRAYPVRILNYHEVVNDVVAGRPVAVTWCPICWSAVTYDRRVEGRTLTFGVSGKLADDALVLYDRETESEWKQPTGEAINGDLEGERLDMLSTPMVTYGAFRRSHPDGVVLQPVRTSNCSQSLTDVYDMAPYEQYAASGDFGLFGMRGEGPRRTWDREDLDAKTPVLGIEYEGEARGYPLPRVKAAGGVVRDSLGGLDLVVVAIEAGLHSFEDPGFNLEIRDDEVYGDGTTWDPLTGQSAEGRTLRRVRGKHLFAFAWEDAYGPDTFYLE